MALNSRSKGKRGEYEVRDLLQEVVNEVASQFGQQPFSIQRNVDQFHRDSEAGGADLLGLPWYALEVKYRETEAPGQVADWWEQAKRQATPEQEPVLLYRKSHAPWRVRMYVYLLVVDGISEVPHRIRTPGDLSIEAFLAYVRSRLVQEYRKAGFEEVTP